MVDTEWAKATPSDRVKLLEQTLTAEAKTNAKTLSEKAHSRLRAFCVDFNLSMPGSGSEAFAPRLQKTWSSIIKTATSMLTSHIKDKEYCMTLLQALIRLSVDGMFVFVRFLFVLCFSRHKAYTLTHAFMRKYNCLPLEFNAREVLKNKGLELFFKLISTHVNDVLIISYTCLAVTTVLGKTNGLSDITYWVSGGEDGVCVGGGERFLFRSFDLPIYAIAFPFLMLTGADFARALYLL